MTSLTLGARAFFAEFLAELEKEQKVTKLHEIYQKNAEWTAMMLGTSKSRKNEDFGVIGRIGQRFSYNIEPEWRRIDQVWYYYLPTPEKCKQKPWRNDVIIEHENYIDQLEYTFNKFGEISAPLKVGIFYPGKKDELKYLEKCQQIISKQIPSYPGEVHLIVFGFLDEEKSEVYWHAYEIDLKGNAITLHK